jgi:hypothetical protein
MIPVPTSSNVVRLPLSPKPDGTNDYQTLPASTNEQFRAGRISSASGMLIIGDPFILFEYFKSLPDENALADMLDNDNVYQSLNTALVLKNFENNAVRDIYVQRDENGVDDLIELV